jgi:hypothetical protein
MQIVEFWLLIFLFLQKCSLNEDPSGVIHGLSLPIKAGFSSGAPTPRYQTTWFNHMEIKSARLHV